MSVEPVQGFRKRLLGIRMLCRHPESRRCTMSSEIQLNLPQGHQIVLVFVVVVAIVVVVIVVVEFDIVYAAQNKVFHLCNLFF